MSLDISRLPEAYQRQILEKLASQGGRKNHRPNKAVEPDRTNVPTEFFYVIYGDPRTKKNHQQILGKGPRCPVCRKPETQFIGQGEAHNAYKEKAKAQIRLLPEAPIDYPVNVKCIYYMQTERVVDQLNLLAATDDLLVEAGVLKDDNVKIVKAHDGSRVRYDKKNPRVEITITPFKEEKE